MREDGFELGDVIGDGIGRLPMDGQRLQGLGAMDDRYLDEWGTEPEAIETMESQQQ